MTDIAPDAQDEAPKPKGPNTTYLSRFIAKLREMFSAQESITREQFDAAYKHARGAAGGVAYPAKMAEGDQIKCPACDAMLDVVDGELPTECPYCGEAIEIEAEPAQASEPAHDPIIFDVQLAPNAFAEAPAWIPYLPKPGTYPHPRYGEIKMTPERTARFIQNFASKVYQDRIPIDLEHETKLSGAAGWITGLRQNADGSADAAVEWTDRGRQALASDRFKFFSPEWYDAWQSPIDGKQYQDVAIGGALTTRPFFKDPALRPLVASERGFIDTDIPLDNAQGDTRMADEQQFTELQAEIAALKQANEALKSTSEQATAQSTQLAERLVAVENERRAERFVAMVKGTDGGSRWFGETAGHVSHLQFLAKTAGEDSDEFKNYVANQRAVAVALKDSAIFAELGSDATPREESAGDKLDRLAKLRASEKNITVPQAYTELLAEDATLYA